MDYLIVNNNFIKIPENAIAYKYADPTEDARFLYDPEEVEEIKAEDPSLIIEL